MHSTVWKILPDIHTRAWQFVDEDWNSLSWVIAENCSSLLVELFFSVLASWSNLTFNIIVLTSIPSRICMKKKKEKRIKPWNCVTSAYLIQNSSKYLELFRHFTKIDGRLKLLLEIAKNRSQKLWNVWKCHNFNKTDFNNLMSRLKYKISKTRVKYLVCQSLSL